jgi:hypothetical protein
LLCALNHSFAAIGTIPLPPYGRNPLMSPPGRPFLERLFDRKPHVEG